MTRLLLLRHGESQGNVERRLQGTAPYPLTELGRRQGEELAARVLTEGADILYTSPTQRAFETGEIIAAATGLPLRVLDGVREYDFGGLSGKTMAEIAAEHPQWALAVREGRPVPPLAGEEGHGPFRERVCAALWGLADRHPDETVAVVSHSGTIAVFCLDVLGVQGAKPISFFGIDNCSITVVDAHADGAAPPGQPRGVIATLNDTCHAG